MVFMTLSGRKRTQHRSFWTFRPFSLKPQRCFEPWVTELHVPEEWIPNPVHILCLISFNRTLISSFCPHHNQQHVFFFLSGFLTNRLYAFLFCSVRVRTVAQLILLQRRSHCHSHLLRPDKLTLHIDGTIKHSQEEQGSTRLFCITCSIH
jgi:hypothetical protein